MKDYFKITNISKDTYLLFEKKGVACYLLEGKDKALLIDTGYGHETLKAKVLELTDKPLIVVNTHVHPDHSGGNHMFSNVYASSLDIPKQGKDFYFNDMIKQMKEGMKKKKTIKNIFYSKACQSFSNSQLKKEDLTPLSLNQTFDLGNRIIEVIECGGHTPGSVIYLDQKTQTLFMGDTLGIWLFTNPDKKLSDYIQQLKSLQTIKGYKTLWLSHVPHSFPFEYLNAFILFLESLKQIKPKVFHLPGFEDDLLLYKYKDPSFGLMMAVLFKNQNI